MAIIASVIGLDVCRIFTRGRGAIMAGRARSRDCIVIESRWNPGVGGMTIIANIV